MAGAKWGPLYETIEDDIWKKNEINQAKMRQNGDLPHDTM
jgi:hypothetical protein